MQPLQQCIAGHGGKTLLFFLFTTAIAASMGLLLVNVVRPGEGLDPAIQAALMEQFATQAAVTLEPPAEITKLTAREREVLQLVAQGAANLVTPLFGGIPATGACTSDPFAFTTRRRPARSLTSILPPGRNAMAQGLCNPVTKSV